MKNRIVISKSKRKEDYEILIKQKYDKGFLAYCPQINKMVKGESFEEVHAEIANMINKHIQRVNPENVSQ